MEVFSAHRLLFRAETDAELVAVSDPGLRIRLGPDGRSGVLSASPLSGRWQILVRSVEASVPRFAGTVTLAPGVPAEIPLRPGEPVRVVDLVQLRSFRIE
jgi:hypothetical protein